MFVDRRATMGAYLFIALVLVTAWMAHARGQGAAEAPLSVVLATPRGEVRDLYSIDVTFSEPMVKLGERGRGGRSVLEISPALKGSYTWMGTSAVSFVLEAPPPAGTAIQVEIPRGTKSLSGKSLATDERWEIVFRRPRLIASSPEPAPLTSSGEPGAPEIGVFPVDDPILLLFDRAPRAGAQGSVTLYRWTGEGGLGDPNAVEVPIAPVSPTPSQLDDLAERLGRETIEPNRVLAFRARAPLDPDHVYHLKVGTGIRFEGSDLGLLEEVQILFRTLGDPEVRSAEAERGTIYFTLASPTHPDSLLRHARFDPPVRRLVAWEGSDTGVWVEGSFPAGQSVRVTIPAGLPDLYGRRTRVSFTQTLNFPHDWPDLMVEPGMGAMMPGPDEALQIQTHNLGPVTIRGLWLKASEGPLVADRLSNDGVLLSREPWRNPATWATRWFGPIDWQEGADAADTTRVWRKRFDELPARPADGQTLYLEAWGINRFPESPEQPETLRTYTLLQFTKLGITSRIDREHGLLWVTDLATGKPMANARVTLWDTYDAAGNPAMTQLWKGTTDQDGIAWTPGVAVLAPIGIPRVAQADTGTDRAWLGLSIHEWNIEGLRTTPPPAAALLTDRPIYRPGERVEYKLWLRDATAKGLALSTQRTVEVRLDAHDGAPQKQQVSLNALGNGHGHFVLPQNGRTGYYTLEVVVPNDDDNGASLGSISLQVEAYRAPRFQASVEVSPHLLLSGGQLRADARFRYWNGGGLGGQPVDWSLSLAPTYWSPPNWGEFTFNDEKPVTARPSDRPYTRRRWFEGPSVLREGKATLDREGRLTLREPIILPPETGDSYATFEFGARDLSDQSAFARDGALVVRGPLRVGVRPLWDEESDRSSRATFEWVVVDTGGVPQPGLPVMTELWRHDYKTTRIRRLGGLFEYENVPFDTLIAKGRMESTAAAYKQSIVVPGPGEYRLRVYPEQPGGEELGGSASIYVSGSSLAQSPRPTTWWLDLNTDQRAYAPTDTARLVIPAPTGGAEALVILNSAGLVRARRVNLTGTPRIEVPLLDLAPGQAAIDAVLVGPDRVPTRPGQGPRVFLPYHAKGYAYFEVTNGRWEAKLEMKPERDEVAPGDSVAVDFVLLGAEGRPVAGEIALAVVDEAVLALVDDNSIDPLVQLFGRRRGDVVEDDLRSQLRLTPELPRGKSSPGGGGSDAAAAAMTRANFRATAYWNPAIAVGPDGRARVIVPMTDDLSRYRFRAVASTVRSEFARAEASVAVSRAIEIEAATPRALRVGDAWTLGAVVRNRGQVAIEARVRCDIQGARLKGPAEQKRKLAPGENWRADFALETPNSGTVRYLLEAVGEAPGVRVIDRVTRNLIASVPLHRETEVTFGVAGPKAEETIALSNLGSPEGLSFTVGLSPTLLTGLAPAIEYLVGYPHGCLEQVNSQTLGWLARRALADRLPADTLSNAEVEARINAGLARIAAQYSPDGYRLWPNGGPHSAYLNAYTAWTLARAKGAGFAVDGDLLAATDALLGLDLERPEESALEPDVRALLAWLRLETGEGEPNVSESTLERLFTYSEQLGTAGRLCLGLAYDRYEVRRRGAGTLRKQASAELAAQTESHIKALIDLALENADRTASKAALNETNPGWGAHFSSEREDRVRATALGTLLLSRRAHTHPFLPLFTRWLLEERRHGHWANTHENAWALSALTEYAEKAENLRLPIEARLVLGLNRTEGTRFEKGKLTPYQRRFTLDDLTRVRRPIAGQADLPIVIETGGQEPIFYDLRLDRSFSSLGLGPREEGLIVLREYTGKDGKPLARLRRGEPVFTHLAIVVPQAASYLVVEDPLPAGCEAVNLDFKTSSRTFYEQEESVVYDYAASEDAGDESQGLFPISYRSLLDDRARFYADDIPAGVYHLYYPITPTTPGRFGTPGARVEMLYAPEVYATSGSETVIVE
ncbi:MAG: hypothetical protein IT349_19495 [Candidatus Eisenbacteria bacterium]|nr:hypothetical protein [Candidatus Eisenbacteria bacterium]